MPRAHLFYHITLRLSSIFPENNITILQIFFHILGISVKIKRHYERVKFFPYSLHVVYMCKAYQDR
jgi:hypothetical protein